MFQHYNPPSSHAANSAKHLQALRELMKNEGIHIWLLPHNDEFNNEYPPEHAWRLRWLSGFSGSAGYGIITMDEAVIFVDGRYRLQVKEQIDLNHFQADDLISHPPSTWLKEHIAKQQQESLVIGFDPWLMSVAAHKRFEASIRNSKATLTPLPNLIDQIWNDQPELPLNPITIHPLEYAGQLAMDKIEAIAHKVAEADADYLLISDPSCLAWLFNIRSTDTPHTPLPLGYAILGADQNCKLFLDKRRMTTEVEAYLTQLADLVAPNQFDETLGEISPDKQFMVDPANCSYAVSKIITNAKGRLIKTTDPIQIAKACKNKTEISGSRTAHLWDGVAMCKFLSWLDQQQPGSIDEIMASQRLEEFRAQTAQDHQSELKDISFDTISGAGPNGAIVHYRVDQRTNRKLENNSLYLIDSGGQYEQGTTDITRTIAVGTPPSQAIKDFTLVLKGHIGIATMKFPAKSRGVEIDSHARWALWQHGRDYAHGTGHGIGSYLSVHEGPQSISARGNQTLLEGMILSNEPGYYRAGEYGIRIENLILVLAAEPIEDGDMPMHQFETLSHVPIDQRLIDVSLLTPFEIQWIDNYHAKTANLIGPHLSGEELNWLISATLPLS